MCQHQAEAGMHLSSIACSTNRPTGPHTIPPHPPGYCAEVEAVILSHYY